MPHKPNNAVSIANSINMEVLNTDYQRLDHNCALIDEESTPELPNYGQNKHNNYLNLRCFSLRSTWLIIVLCSVIVISSIVIVKRFGPSFVKKV